MRIPTCQQCLDMLRDNLTPPDVVSHTIAVKEFALSLSQRLAGKGIAVNLPLVEAAVLLHDIEKVKPDHVVAGHDLIKAKGYLQVATVMLKHGLEHLDDDAYRPKAIEEKIVFYADKRVLGSKVVSIDERFAYLRKTYNFPGVEHEIAFTKGLEEEFREILGDSP